MSFETIAKIPAAKEHFTVSATCQSCADKVAAEILDLADYVGMDMIRHTVSQIDPAQATIKDSSGTIINTGLQHHNI